MTKNHYKREDWWNYHIVHKSSNFCVHWQHEVVYVDISLSFTTDMEMYEMIATSSSHVPYKNSRTYYCLYYSIFVVIYLYIQRHFQNVNYMNIISLINEHGQLQKV